MEEKLKKIISDYTGLSADEIDTSADIQTELGLDSFAVISVLCDLEDAFGIQIPDEDFANLKTLDDVITYLEQHQAQVA